MRDAFIQALTTLAREDERIFLLTGDLGFGVFEKFAAEFPGRYVNVGVAEQNMTGVAAGLASAGKIPFTYSIANFPTVRCLEQVRIDVCYQNANVKIVAVGGGLAYGVLGPTHHGTEDFAILRALPNMRVIAPADPVEAALATRAAAMLVGPVYLRLGKAGEPRMYESAPDFAIGRAIVVRPGRDLTLIATGGIALNALKAAEILAQDGIDARVLSMHTIKPLDIAAVVAAARETRAIWTVEEHVLNGGLGGAVAEALLESDAPKVPFCRLTLGDTFAREVGSQEYLRARAGLSAEGIARTVKTGLTPSPSPTRLERGSGGEAP